MWKLALKLGKFLWKNKTLTAIAGGVVAHKSTDGKSTEYLTDKAGDLAKAGLNEVKEGALEMVKEGLDIKDFSLKGLFNALKDKPTAGALLAATYGFVSRLLTKPLATIFNPFGTIARVLWFGTVGWAIHKGLKHVFGAAHDNTTENVDTKPVVDTPEAATPKTNLKVVHKAPKEEDVQAPAAA